MYVEFEFNADLKIMLEFIKNSSKVKQMNMLSLMTRLNQMKLKKNRRFYQ